MTDTDMLYMASLEKRNEELEAKVAELEGKHHNECAADHRQLAEWLMELKDLREENKVLIQECDRLIKEKGELLKKSEQIAEYKRLLKAAVEDFSYIGSTGTCIGGNCERCPLEGEKQNSRYACTNWKHEAEALALIGEDTNVPVREED